MAKEQQTVGFRIGQETFGLPVSLVHEIVRVPEIITNVPDAPGCVEGVINLRGRIVPLVDLRKRFGIRVEPNHKARVLVVDLEGKRVGLIVDAANEVLRIPEDEIAPAPSVLAENEIKYVTGLGKVGGRLIILVDLAKLLERGQLVSSAKTIAALTGEAEAQTQVSAGENSSA